MSRNTKITNMQNNDSDHIVSIKIETTLFPASKGVIKPHLMDK